MVGEECITLKWGVLKIWNLTNKSTRALFGTEKEFMMKFSYQGLNRKAERYYVYFMFFEGSNGEFYVKVGKSGSLATRFRDLQKGNPLKLFAAFSIDVDEFDLVADGMEYIFKHRLGPFNTTGEWFQVTDQLFDFLEHIMYLVNFSQDSDEEAFETNDSEFFSLIGHRSDSGFSMEYDWDEIFRSNADYRLKETTYDSDNTSVRFGKDVDFREVQTLIRAQMKRSGYVPSLNVKIEPNFSFRDYFDSFESGKERKKWWNGK